MSITTEQQSALSRPVVRAAYFVEFRFAGGISRACTFDQTIQWGGQEWLGLGAIGSISAVEESDGLEARAMTFSLNAAQPSWIALAAGPVEEYRGRAAKMWMCPLDDGNCPIGEPVLCWQGLMDVVSIGIDGDEGVITLKCETSIYGIKRRPSLRLNAAQHKQRFGNDTGLDFVEDLIHNPQTWLSKKVLMV